MNHKPLFPTSATASQSRRSDGSRQLTSAHISEHLATFQARGGQVEVLGTTAMLKRIQPGTEAKAEAG